MMMRYVLILMGLFCWMGSALAEPKTETYDLTTSTFTQVSTAEAVHDVRVSRHTVSFKLDDPIWHYTYNQNPINFVGSQVKITTVTLPDIATNTTNLPNVPSVSILDETGNVLATSTSCTPQSTTIQLASIDGSHVDVKPYVYAFSPAVPLDTSKTYTLRLNPNDNLTTPLLPVFRNASSEYTDADTSVVRIDGSAEGVTPYLAFDGEMTMTRFIYELSATADKSPHSLKSLLDDDDFTTDDTTNDNKDTMVIVRLKEMDTILQMDHSLVNAAMIVATDTPATTWNQEGTGDWRVKQRAGTVRFIEGDYRFTGPWDFRDVTGAKGEIKMIRLEYYDKEGNPKTTTKTADNKTETVADPIPRGLWNPKSFALYCDLEFSAYPNMSEDPDSWFGRNPITIPSGRSVRIVTHVDEANRPKLAFTDATSRLALAIPTNEAHVLSHYRNLIEQNSGILRFVSPFEIHEKTGTESTGHTASLVLGMDNLSSTAPSVQTLESYNTTTFTKALVLGYGVDNKAQYVQHTGDVSIGGEGLFIGQANPALAKYFLKDGQLKTDRVTFGHKAHDAALIVGDGEGDANSAVANLSQLLASDVSNTDDVTGSATVIVRQDGELILSNSIAMKPALHRSMQIQGGRLTAKGDALTFDFGSDPSAGGGLIVDNGATIDATQATSLTLDAITGFSAGTVTFDGNVTVGTLADFCGKVTLANPDAHAVTINRLYGVNSDICFGDLGENGTTSVATILALARTSAYRGTLSFDAEDYPYLNVAATPELDLNARLRIQNGQTLRIRLDQFADATILWPETIDTTNPPKLILIESGAYGGILSISHLPELVAQNTTFEYYVSGSNTTPHAAGTWMIEPDENGATDTFTWEYPHFTGNSAWIDAEFEGNGDNTGWLYFDAKKEGASRGNVLLKGYEIKRDDYGNQWNDWGALLNEARYYTETSNPKGQGIKMRYRPYIAPEVLTYPDVWSAAIRLTAPNASSTAILAIGSSINNTDALVLATGDTAQELVLWHLPRNDANAMVAVTRATIADIVNVPHVFSAVCDGTKLTIYIDGGFLTEYTLPSTWQGLKRGGLQVGQVLDDNSNAQGITERLKGAPQDDTGSVDYIRFYKGALTAQAMEVLADETPPVKQDVRYIREVRANGSWEDTANKPWYKETWNGSAWKRATTGEERPAEGSEIRLYTNGSYTLEVNTTRQASIGFLSRDWMYSSLNVYPLEGATSPEIKLKPIGTTIGTNTSGDSTPDKLMASTWYTNRTDGTYTYGRLKFTGGQGDPIHTDAACTDYDNPTGALGIHGLRSTNNATITVQSNSAREGDVTESSKRNYYASSSNRYTWTATRVVTQTQVLKRTVSGQALAARFTPSAGVVHFSRSANIFLGAIYASAYVETQTRTRTITQTRTGTSRNSSTRPTNWSAWSPTYDISSDSGWSAWNEGEWIVDTSSASSTATLTQAELQYCADYSLIRGREEDESKLVHLTGPVVGEGKLIPNPSVLATSGQASTCVWVPTFSEGLNWLFSDVTETAYGANSNNGGRVNGLLVQVRQIPGRLYLDLAQTNSKLGFSKQAWYRYGYPGDTTVKPAPVVASEADFAAAIAFQIRVPQDNTKILTMDVARDNIATLNIEAATNATTTPTLSIVGTEGLGLTITKQLITSVRLEDLSDTPALLFDDKALLHGHTTGTYAFKNRNWTRAMVNDSIATLEAHGTTNTIEDVFELRNTALVVAAGARLEQTKADKYLWAKALTMGEGAIFAFRAAGEDVDENGVVLSGNVTLLGNATLHGYGQADGTNNLHRCNFTANAIVGPADEKTETTLTVNSEGDERWICYTADIQGGNVGLTKVGTGIMAFRSPSAPSFTGPITINEGILRVGTTPISSDVLKNDEHTGTSIGHKGLHVAAGASLEPNHYANAEDLIACIPSGQTLSGTGTIGGVLRLNSGALLKDCAGMTIRKMVVDGSTSPDITVKLPTDIEKLPTDIEGRAILFHMLEDSARAEVRRRFYATRNGERWDVCVNHTAGVDGRSCQSHYWVQSPRVPVPTGLTTNDGNAFTGAFTNTMTRYYQGYSISRLLSSTGYTKYVNADSNHKLNASEIENAFNCFSHVWTFDKDEAKNTLNSTYVDDEASLLMAYEFGITRMDVRDIGETRYLIVEVKVENALGKAFGNHVTGANNVADFQLNTQVAFYRVHEDEETAPTRVDGVQEIVSFDATDLTGPSEQTHTPGFRAFAIPFDKDHFPMGTTSLSVKVTL